MGDLPSAVAVPVEVVDVTGEVDSEDELMKLNSAAEEADGKMSHFFDTVAWPLVENGTIMEQDWRDGYEAFHKVRKLSKEASPGRVLQLQAALDRTVYEIQVQRGKKAWANFDKRLLTEFVRKTMEPEKWSRAMALLRSGRRMRKRLLLRELNGVAKELALRQLEAEEQETSDDDDDVVTQADIITHLTHELQILEEMEARARKRRERVEEKERLEAASAASSASAGEGSGSASAGV